MVAESVNDHIIRYPHPKSNICSRFVHHHRPRRALRVRQIDKPSGREVPVGPHHVGHEVDDFEVCRLWQVTGLAGERVFRDCPVDDRR
jgi:hypothetical protein